jgi:hypothetical protein
MFMYAMSLLPGFAKPIAGCILPPIEERRTVTPIEVGIEH